MIYIHSDYDGPPGDDAQYGQHILRKTLKAANCQAATEAAEREREDSPASAGDLQQRAKQKLLNDSLHSGLPGVTVNIDALLNKAGGSYPAGKQNIDSVGLNSFAPEFARKGTAHNGLDSIDAELGDMLLELIKK